MWTTSTPKTMNVDTKWVVVTICGNPPAIRSSSSTPVPNAITVIDVSVSPVHCQNSDRSVHFAFRWWTW